MMMTIMIVMMVVILMKWVIYDNHENYGFQEKTEFQSNSKTLKPAFSKHPLLPLKVMMMMLMKSKTQAPEDFCNLQTAQ